MAAPRDVVHQINFGLQQDDGVAVLGGTMSDEDKLVWLRRLQTHLRLQRFGSTLPPDRALSTFEFTDGFTAVVRRWSTGGTIGRNDAMALIAPSSRLPLPVVLGLDQRFDWQQAAQQRPFQKWDAEQMQGLGEQEAQPLRAAAKQQPDLLRRALAQLFDAPSRPLTIVGCPDAQRIPLLWGLHKLAARELLQHNLRRPWTFSTYEVEDADSIPNLPAIVFLPDHPVGATVSRRTLADVRTDGDVSRESADRAVRRVDALLGDREEQPDFAEQPSAPSRPLRELPSVSRETVRLREVGIAAGAATTGGDVWPDDEQIYRSGREPDGDAALAVPEGRPLAAALSRVQQAGSPRELADGMSALERLAATAGDREELRSSLGPSGVALLAGVVTRLALKLPDGRAFFDRLQRITYGPDRGDLHLPDVSDFAADVLAARPSTAFGEALLADLRGHADPAVLDRQFAQRWLGELGLPVSAAKPTERSATALDEEDAQAGSWRLPALFRDEQQPVRRTPGWMLPALTSSVVTAVLALVAYLVLDGSGAPRPTGPTPTAAATAEPSIPAVTATTSPPTPATAPGALVPAVVPEVDGAVGDRSLVVRLPKADLPRTAEVHLLLRPVTTGAFYYYRLCEDEPNRFLCRQPSDKAAPPPDPAGYDVVLVKSLKGEPVTGQNGLSTVGTPQPEDYVAPPVRIRN